MRIRRSSDLKTCACVAISSSSVLIRNRSNLECSTTETGFLCSVIIVNTFREKRLACLCRNLLFIPVKVDTQPDLGPALYPQAPPPNRASALPSHQPWWPPASLYPSCTAGSWSKEQPFPPSITLVAEAPPTGSSDQSASLHNWTRPQSSALRRASVTPAIVLKDAMKFSVSLWRAL